MEVESGKKVKITKIIDEGFLFKKNLSKLTKNLKNPEVAEEIFSKLILPTKEQYEIVKNLQIFSEVTFHSLKRINLPNTEKTLVFCCSSVSPLNYKTLDDSVDSKVTTEDSAENSAEKSNIRIKKRENSEPCPMRLKFIFDQITKEYKICHTSNFLHNHSPICNDFEVKKYLIFFFILKKLKIIKVKTI